MTSTTLHSALLPPFEPSSMHDMPLGSVAPLPQPRPPAPMPTPAAADSSNYISTRATASMSSSFTRQRSSSVHNTSSLNSSPFRHDASHAPPVPSIPSTPTSFMDGLRSSPTSSSLARHDSDEGASGPSAAALHDALYPPIKSVTVPHHSKSGKSWVFACRIVPESKPAPEDPCVGPASASVFPGMARRTSSGLGRMTMAGRGEADAREPHTVWRTWTEFVDFSQRLSAAFPVVNSPEPTSPSALPSSFYRQTPRLSKKLTLFVTRATLAQRQQDLDLFTRRLFDMPREVKRSALVRDFFKLREEDLTAGGPASPFTNVSTPAAPAPSDMTQNWGEISSVDDGPESFSSFLAAASGSPNATVRPFATRQRPGLVVKHSTPNLRHESSEHDEMASVAANALLSSGTRPNAVRSTTVDDAGLRAATDRGASQYSVSTTSSASSTMTVTPQTLSGSSSSASVFAAQQQQQMAKKASPLGAEFRFGGTNAKAHDAAAVKPVEPKKRPSLGPLRHFRSLQDLRSSGSPQTLAIPSEPVPKLSVATLPSSGASSASRSMMRAVTQPLSSMGASRSPYDSPSTSPSLLQHPFPLPLSASSAYTPPSSQSLSRHRSTVSKSSSTSSFEDLWGILPPAHHQQQQHSPTSSIINAQFRHGPSGRITRDPDPVPLPRPRRPSMPQSRSTSGSISRPGHHKNTLSTSSVGSNRSRSSAGGSSVSMDMTRSLSDYRSRSSRRSSTDYSTFSESGQCGAGLSTPPTPQSEFGVNCKYFVENGQLSQNNKVPPPPFFPVPPPSSAKMDVAYSHDGLPHTPRHNRNSSLESRPRTSSTTSRRPLDTIMASPKVIPSGQSSPASTTSSQAQYLTSSPRDRPYLTFKLLHPEANLVMRVPRADLTLQSLRSHIRDKFAAVACGVKLESEDAHWGLAFHGIPSESSRPPSTQLIITETDLDSVLEQAAALEKISLRVVS